MYKAHKVTMPAGLDEAAVEEVVTAREDLLSRFAVPGKSLLMPDNQWWTIKSRDIKADKIVLELSSFAKKDGVADKPDKDMSWATFLKNAGVKWGITLAGKKYGPTQDKEDRADTRKDAGLRKAPGTP
jgi:hypothetical protein